jgi:hypothetical protein
MRLFALCSIVTVLLLSTLPSYSADPQHGFVLAKRWLRYLPCCFRRSTACQRRRPPFATIARSPNFNPRDLAYFLLNPHPKMPDLPLSRAAADDIAAYIASLKR